jgi:hypothetical protein
MAVQGGAVGDDDAGRFLPAMLLGEESLIGQLRSLRRPPDAKDAALFLFLLLNADREGNVQGGSPKAHGISFRPAGQFAPSEIGECDSDEH